MSQRAPELKIAALDSQSATDTRKTKICLIFFNIFHFIIWKSKHFILFDTVPVNKFYKLTYKKDIV